MQRVFYFLILAVLALSPRGAMAQTLGDVITNTVQSTSTISIVESFLAYCIGCFFCVLAIFRFKDHVDNPAQTPISQGMKRFFAGGMFLSLPFMTDVVRGTVYQDGTSEARGTSPGLDPSVATTDALDDLVIKFMSDIAGPMQLLLSAFTYFMAIGLLMVGINRLTKRLDDGPRGPAGMGTIMTFLTSGVLFAWGDMIGAFTNSLFNPAASGQTKTVANLDASLNLGADEARIEQVIQGVMLFIIIVGMIAFIRGWLVLRAFADGQQGATLAQGLTFIFGGAAAINLGDLINAVQVTLGITDTITFS